MGNELENDLFGGVSRIVKPPRSKYQRYKVKFNYCKGGNLINCGNCKNTIKYELNDKIYRKCKLLGISSSVATDIRKGYACDNFYYKG